MQMERLLILELASSASAFIVPEPPPGHSASFPSIYRRQDTDSILSEAAGRAEPLGSDVVMFRADQSRQPWGCGRFTVVTAMGFRGPKAPPLPGRPGGGTQSTPGEEDSAAC